MRILILGFGLLARELSSQIKHFPEYGAHKQVSIYHIFTRRNSLSYGKNLVVEIPDPHGDGYRTYKDGLQALDDYSTTVSNYKPWLLEEAQKGAFDVIINCMPKTTEAYTLISEILSRSIERLTSIPANIIGVDATIGELRRMIDGGDDWEPVKFSEGFLKEASDAWSAAQVKMEEYHMANRNKDIAKKLEELGGLDLSGRRPCFIAIPDFDRDLIDRFVVNGDYHEEYTREEIYDQEHDCLIIKHMILEQFFGWHHTEQNVAVAFFNPNIEIESATYIKYLSKSSKHMEFTNADYVVEHVHRGKLEIIDANESLVELGPGFQATAYGYRPKIDPPAKTLFSAGTETIVFTYKEKIK
jgi:hypothetical protein